MVMTGGRLSAGGAAVVEVVIEGVVVDVVDVVDWLLVVVLLAGATVVVDGFCVGVTAVVVVVVDVVSGDAVAVQAVMSTRPARSHRLRMPPA